MKIIAKNQKNKNNTSRVISWPDSPLISPEQNDLFSAQGANISPLGNNTKSAATFAPEYPAIERKKRYRRNRYAMLALSRKFSPKGQRVKECSCHPGKKEGGERRDSVSVEKSGNRAWWGGVSVCGSVWSCPVCSEKIQIKRQAEVLFALRNHRESGGYSLLVTFTHRHNITCGLKGEMEKVANAHRRMKATRAYKDIRSEFSQIGHIKALEVTYGANGWHPHTHEIWFLEGEGSEEKAKELEQRLYELWADYCGKVGLGLPTRANGVRVDYRDPDGSNLDAVGAYVTKWASELTGNQHKKSRFSGRTPWQILEGLGRDYSSKDSALWREYCNAMKGRAMLFWSPGLKDRFGVDDMPDEQIAEGLEAVETDSLKVSIPQWYAIVRAGKQAHVLEVMESSGVDETRRYIEKLHTRDRENRRRHEIEKIRLRKWASDSTSDHMRSIGMI